MAAVSVIIPTCDRPELLARAMASIHRQESSAGEIIVVNDGLGDIAVEGAKVVRTGPHAGPAAARNAGARASVCEHLAFLDDDDEWRPDHLGTVCELLKDGDVAATAFLRHTRTGGVEVREPPIRLVASAWLVCNQGIQGSNLAMRRQSFHELQGFDELLWCGEDMDLAIRCAEAGVRYAASTTPTVTCHAHSLPRITSPGPRHRHAHRTFLAAHGSRMSTNQVQEYRERATRLFGMDPGPLPRLVWVLGPPGAGKTTWATRHARGNDRVLDLIEAMPWLDGADLGVHTAKRHIAAAIRATESQRPEGDRRLFVTPAYFSPEDLGQAQDFEHIIAVVPSAECWRAQIQRREGFVDKRHALEHESWAARFGTCARAATAGCSS